MKLFATPIFKTAANRWRNEDHVRHRRHCFLSILLTGALLAACSGKDAARLARGAVSGDAGVLEALAMDKAAHYALDPQALQKDFEAFARLVEKFRRAVEQVWGRDEHKEPRQKQYVKYLQNYLSRALVDFDGGLVTVETLDPKNPTESLQNAIVTTLLTPEDPRAVDLYSAREVEIGPTPFLLGEVKDHEGRDIRWRWRAERFAAHLLAHGHQERSLSAGGASRSIHYVEIPMVQDHVQIRVQRYRSWVQTAAREFDVSGNTIYAVIHTESSFNPYAVSSAPAYGLMQVVPATAGRDVYRHLNGTDGVPDRQFLLQPSNNIRYGTAYLHLLGHQYLKDIRHPVSREYCVIAGYNAGVGTVLRTFDTLPRRPQAVQTINRQTPQDVYQALRTKMSSREGRRYLKKVLDAKKAFVNI